IYVRGLRAESDKRNGNASEERVRSFVNGVAIFKRAGLGFVGVTNEIDCFLLISLDEAPLHTARKSGAAAATQSRCLHFVHDVGPRPFEGFLQLFVAAMLEISIDVDLPILASDVFEDQPILERVRLVNEFCRRL